MSDGTDEPFITGGVVSCTVTLNEAFDVLPFPSPAEQLTAVVPMGKVEPEEGEHPTGRGPVTASCAVGLL
jgi:hypothetical protein